MAKDMKKLIDHIDDLRVEYHACTAGALAQRVGMSKSWVFQSLIRLREKGIVDWTTMPGSVHVVEGARAVDAAEATGDVPDPSGVGDDMEGEATGTAATPVAGPALKRVDKRPGQ